MKSIKFKRIFLPILLFTLLICIPANLWCQSIKVACIGDSITYGWKFSDRDTDAPPGQLQRLLGSGYTVNNYGVSGATLMKSGDKPYWDLSVYTDSTNWLPNIVIIMLGTNDSKSSNWSKKENFVPDSLAMINHYKNLSSNPVVYLATCPKVYDSGNFGITDPIVTGEIVPLQKQVASDTDTPLIDVNAATSNMPENFPDKVHPNVEGAAVIAQAWYAAITSSSPTHTPSPPPTPPPTPTPARTMGDVNEDETIDIVDALLIAQYYVGLNPVGFVSANADVNCSEDIDIVDALLVAQYYVGLITAFEGCEQPTEPVTYELQAEDATWDNAVVDSQHAGYTGSGFVDTVNSSGTWIEWNLNVENATNALCVFRYACASDDRSMDLSINGNPVIFLSFPASGSWTTWSTEEATGSLNAGSNTIRLTAATSGGAPNIDKMDITVNIPPLTATPF